MNWKATELSLVDIKYSNKEDGKNLISMRDTYVNNLTSFDLEARCGFRDAEIKDYLRLCRENVLNWTDYEVSKINKIVLEIDSELKKRGLSIPYIDNINLVKTTSLEECGAMAYTRGNAIYVAKFTLNIPEEKLKEIITHELFHILSRSSFSFKQEMYGIIGFIALDKAITLTNFNPRYHFISNPDVGNLCSYIELKDLHEEKHRLMMTTMASSDYHGGPFFSYIQPYFIELNIECDVMTDEENLPLREPIHGKYYQEFIKKVGLNTGYMVNPEEILAENFRMAVLRGIHGVPNPEIIDNIYKVMKKN